MHFRTNRRFGNEYANDCGKCGNQMGKVGSIKAGSQSNTTGLLCPTVRNGLVATAFGRTVVLGYTGMDRLEFYGADDAGKLTVRSVYGAGQCFFCGKRGYLRLYGVNTH